MVLWSIEMPVLINIDFLLDRLFTALRFVLLTMKRKLIRLNRSSIALVIFGFFRAINLEEFILFSSPKQDEKVDAFGA